ncbi:MAG TPA: cytochrome P450, partial [Polyangia bacterium]|nr:cytochrome P450 [Polyangia bacterium]
VVGGWQLERGEQLLIAPWLMHHDPRWFSRPREFLPERWRDGLEERLPRHVYLPFGGGQRVCAGVHFASMEGTLVLAMAARALSFALVDPAEPELSPAITLRARGPLRLRVRRHIDQV